ncbi:phytoene/squalene synthase family protein (plasmid) [Rhizobium sp. TRM95796]|nr:phytoene/squalene synthase family protein [Rhizobium sp. TRM95796]MCV3765240.1 phytoene/squalene synthase family protein [Rhizobium sp. TRM95796]
MGRHDAYDACLTTLRSTDLDRYLACLLMPEDKRGAVAALYAFNAELARVRDVVRDPLPGEIRLQWWRDLVEGQGAGDAMANPLAAGLIHAVDEYRLPRPALAAMTEARIFDLYDDPMESRRMFEGYAGETSSTLIQMTTLILAPDAAPRLADAAGHAGIAQLVAGTLLLTPLHRRRRQVYLPGDILAATGLTAATFLDGDGPAMAQALSAFIGYGRDHLAAARAAAKDELAQPAADAYLPVALAQAVFDKAEKLGPICLTEPAVSPQWLRMWRLWRAHRRAGF